MNQGGWDGTLSGMPPQLPPLDLGDWTVTERSPEYFPAHESIFAVGNGYLGLGGAPDEGAPGHEPGVSLNGFHETWPIAYPEDAYGMARTGQTTVNVTDGSLIRLCVDGEPLALEHALRYERVLDLRTGVV